MKDHELTAKNINVEFDRHVSFGDRASERIAEFPGSWTFIAVFTGILLVVDRNKHSHLYPQTVRSLSFHPAQPRPVGHCCNSGPGYHHEPEPTGGEGSHECRT